MLGVVGQQCCVRLHVSKSLTGFKLFATTPNNTQQGVQKDTTYNDQQVVVDQQCCVRLHGA